MNSIHLQEAETGTKPALSGASLHLLLVIFTLWTQKHGGFHAENDFPLLLFCPPCIIHTVEKIGAPQLQMMDRVFLFPTSGG